MSHEVRIGILSIVAIALSLWGIKYIQGSNILSKSTTYYAFYDDVSGVQVGTPVQISGVTIGSVSSRELDTQERKVKLTFTLSEEVPLPKDTRAILATKSFLGDMAVIFDYPTPCNGSNCAESGDTFIGATQGMVESMLGEGGLESYIAQLQEVLQKSITSLTEGLVGEDSNGPLAATARDLEATMGNLKNATGRVNNMLQRSSPELEKTLTNIAQLTTTLNEQKKHIAGIVANTDSLSQQMVDARLDEAVVQAKATLAELDETLVTAKSAMSGVDDLMGQLKQGEGSLGKLLYDDALYQNLNALSYSLDSLSSDLKERPYRYVPLKSRRRVKRSDRKDAEDGGK